MELLKVLLVLVLVYDVSYGQVGPQVTIPGLGIVQGDTDLSYVNKRSFNRFKGIPFASPPVRFQPPVPPVPWVDIFDATNWGRACPQKNLDLTVPNAEDCLYIHIYTPTLNETANLPVIIYYHGGGFKAGSAIGWGSEIFMDQDVVVVLPHYRLGAFGFLSLETDEIAGNAGMLDQVAALQWVNNYISVFGGDPNSITVMGESAGGASTSLLAISPLSSGLIKGYISQSGAATGGWVIDRDPVTAGIEIGRIAGCTDLSIPALTTCLNTLPTETLHNAFVNYTNLIAYEGQPLFGGGASLPTIQKSGSIRFLERDPIEILEEGAYVHKPALIGSNKHEGTLFYSWLHDYYFAPRGLVNDAEYWKRDATNFMLEWTNIQDQGETLASGVEKAYFGQENMGNLTAMEPGISDYIGNMYIKGVGYSQAVYNSLYADTYIYSYNFYGTNTFWPSMGNPAVIDGGVCHANELYMLFTFALTNLDQREKDLSQKMVKLWTNFATYGNPTPTQSPVPGVPTWNKLDKSLENYLLIDDQPVMANSFTITEYFAARDGGIPPPP